MAFPSCVKHQPCRILIWGFKSYGRKSSFQSTHSPKPFLKHRSKQRALLCAFARPACRWRWEGNLSLRGGHHLLQVRSRDLFRVNTFLILRKDIAGNGSQQRLCAVHGQGPQSSVGTRPRSALPPRFCLTPRRHGDGAATNTARLTLQSERTHFPSRALGRPLWFYKRNGNSLQP